MNFFAVMRGQEPEVRRIPVDRNLQEQLTELFRRQEAELFFEDRDEVPFDVSHKPDESEIAFLEGVELPDSITRCATAPMDHDVLSFGESDPNTICGIVGAETRKGDMRVLIQGFDRRRMLDNSGFSLVLSAETFRRLSDPGIVLDGKLVAVFREKRLYFQSFFSARRVLDLSKYYREATDADVEAFSRHERIHIEDPAHLMGVADTWIRGRIATICDSDLLTRVPPSQIVKEASRYGVNLETKREGAKEMIVFPPDKKEIKSILRLLDESYYTSGLSGEQFLANSKRRL